MLDLLHKCKYVSRRVAPEALITASLFTNVERRGLFAVERAEADPVPTRSPQLHVLPDNIDDRDRCANAFDVIVGNSHIKESSSRRMPSYHSEASPPQTALAPSSLLAVACTDDRLRSSKTSDRHAEWRAAHVVEPDP